MLKNLISKPLTLLLFIVLIICGSYVSISSLPVKMYPNVVKPGFTIWFWHKYIKNPRDLYQSFGDEIEEQVTNLDEVEKIESNYNEGRGRLKIDSRWNVDEKRLKEKIEAIYITQKANSNGELGFYIRTNSENSSGNMMIAVSSDGHTKKELRALLKAKLKKEIESNQWVNKIDFWGWTEEQVALEIDRDKLLSFNLSLGQVKSIITSRYQSVNIGKIDGTKTKEPNQMFIPSSIADPKDILKIKIQVADDKFVTVSDFATIKPHFKERKDVYRLNSVPATFMTVNMKPEGDIKRTCNDVIRILTNFKDSHKGINFNIMVNPAEFVDNSIANLINNGVLGGIAAILVIFIFLGSFRNSLIIGVSIPFCIISSFILMKLFGLTINIISLGGLAIGVGMIVDSSIVCLENIYSKLQKSNGENKLEIIISATKEIIIPVLASILTSIIAFFPIIYTQSYTKAILGELAETVIFTLATSIIASVYIVPSVSYLFMQAKEGPNKFLTKVNNFGSKVQLFYRKMLGHVLLNRSIAFVSILIITAGLFASFQLIPKIKREIIAKPATKLLDINVRIPENDDIKITEKYVNKLESFLKTLPEIKSYSTYVWQPSFGYVTAELSSRHDFERLKNHFNKSFPATPDYHFKAKKWDPGGLPLPDKHDLVVHIGGPQWDKLTGYTDKLAKAAQKLDTNVRRRPWKSYSQDVTLEFNDWVQDRNQIRDYLSAHAQSGSYVSKVFEGDEIKPLIALFKPEQRFSFIDDVKATPIPYQGKIVPLKALATVEQKQNLFKPMFFIDGTAQHKMMIDYNDEKLKDNEEAKTELRAAIEAVELPKDVALTFPDTNKELNDAFNSFKFSLLTSVLLIFFVLTLMFNSLRYPVIIIVTIPFAMIGVITGLYLFDSTLSLNSMLGMILLSGLVVNNAILLIDHYLKLRSDGKEIEESILASCERRLRPIIMTTFTTLFGIFPIAMAVGEGGEILQPLGVSVFCGLLISTFLCLFLVPILIYNVDSIRERIAFFNKKKLAIQP